ncbi:MULTISPECIES: hypothetical protein [unclassified Enterococcus]|uniref:hypothetical protein n=1 Tax=unclassified Enterococcus TaxID=2608891 RepID=UPI0006B8BA1B|nr:MULTISPECIES: hypothetical protein [unclassified Enterococcus]KPG69337.1 hypothetical protein AEQ18_11500 [Enterococcus sp. RIT-PI-f]
MKIDKIEYKRVINNAGHLEYDLLQFLEKNRGSAAAQELKQSEIDYLLSEDIQHRVIQQARKSLFGDSIIIKDHLAEDYLLLKKYTDIFQQSL